MKVRVYGNYIVKRRPVSSHWSAPNGVEYEVYYKNDRSLVATFITLREAREFVIQRQGGLN